MNLTPKYDYIIARKIEKDSGVVTGANIEDTHQYFEVLAVGEGRYEYGVLIKPTVEVGDKVWVMKHADADTPADLANQGLYVFQATRIMAVEDKS